MVSLSVRVVSKATQFEQEVDKGRSKNIRDASVFSGYMEDFLSSKEIDDETRERAKEISLEYFSKYVSSDLSRNVTWRLKKMQWDYLLIMAKATRLISQS